MAEKRFWQLIALAAALGLGVCAALAAQPGPRRAGVQAALRLFCGPALGHCEDGRGLAHSGDNPVCAGVPDTGRGALPALAAAEALARGLAGLALLSAVLLILLGRALDSHRSIYSAFAQRAFFAVLVTWLALRLLRYFSASDDRRLVKLVRIVVLLIGMLFAALAGVTVFAVLASLFERFTLAAFADGAASVASNCITVYGCLLGLRLTNSLGEGGELTDETVEQARGFYRYSVRLRQPSCSRASRRTL